MLRKAFNKMDVSEMYEQQVPNVFSKEERHLLNITEHSLQCSLYDETGSQNDANMSASTIHTSDLTSMTKVSQYNLWTKDMELCCGRVLEKLLASEPSHDGELYNQEEIIKLNDEIGKTCRGQKVKYGLPPFMFLSEASRVDNLIDANFLYTDDHEQFHYMQRYNKFPNSNTLEYVKEMLQPYMEFMEDMANEIADRRQRKLLQEQLRQAKAHPYGTSRAGSHSGSNSQTKVSSSVGSILNKGPVKKWVNLWSRMKRKVRLINNHGSLLQDTAMKVVILMKRNTTK